MTRVSSGPFTDVFAASRHHVRGALLFSLAFRAGYPGIASCFAIGPVTDVCVSVFVTEVHFSTAQVFFLVFHSHRRLHRGRVRVTVLDRGTFLNCEVHFSIHLHHMETAGVTGRTWFISRAFYRRAGYRNIVAGGVCPISRRFSGGDLYSPERYTCGSVHAGSIQLGVRRLAFVYARNKTFRGFLLLGGLKGCASYLEGVRIRMRVDRQTCVHVLLHGTSWYASRFLGAGFPGALPNSPSGGDSCTVLHCES